MKKMVKRALQIVSMQTLTVPKGAIPRSVLIDPMSDGYLWYEADTSSTEHESLEILNFMDGEPITFHEHLNYLGTCHLHNVPSSVHFYWRKFDV